MFSNFRVFSKNTCKSGNNLENPRKLKKITKFIRAFCENWIFLESSKNNYAKL